MTQTEMAEGLITPKQAKLHRILSDLNHATISYISQSDLSPTEKDDLAQIAIETLRPALIQFSEGYRSDSPQPGQCYWDPGSGQWICPGFSDY
jgi:hypothetical protein